MFVVLNQTCACTLLADFFKVGHLGGEFEISDCSTSYDVIIQFSSVKHLKLKERTLLSENAKQTAEENYDHRIVDQLYYNTRNLPRKPLDIGIS